MARTRRSTRVLAEREGGSGGGKKKGAVKGMKRERGEEGVWCVYLIFVRSEQRERMTKRDRMSSGGSEGGKKYCVGGGR